MQKELFIAKTINFSSDLRLDLLFDKEMKPEENVKCWFRITANLDKGRTFSKTSELTYVVEDRMVSIPKIKEEVYNLIQETINSLDALDQGINSLSSFYLETPGIDSDPVEVRKAIKKTLENITKYILEPYIIELYIVLVHYKGTDTLQKRKFEKMIEAQQDAMTFNQFRRI